jgi:WD40 repeat protein
LSSLSVVDVVIVIAVAAEWQCFKIFSLMQCVPIRFLCVLGDGQTLISGNEDYSLRIWDTEKPTANEALVKTMYAQTMRVLTLAVLPDGVTVVSAGFGGLLSVWQCTRSIGAKAATNSERS